jgi:DNA-binding protein Fis
MATFFSTSDKVQDIIKSFNLTKTLFVSSIIIGEAHTGKKTLARHLFPDAVIVQGNNQQEVEKALKQYDELIINNFELLSNQSQLDFSNKRIIATSNYVGNSKLIDTLFAFIYTIPSLKERPRDTEHLKALFIKEAIGVFMLENASIRSNDIPIDLSQNTKSLKKSIYAYLGRYSISTEDIQDLLQAYFLQNLQGKNAYKEYLGLYEKPLIQAGLQKFSSQLKLSEVLGINRNTLRKKIHEQNIF